MFDIRFVQSVSVFHSEQTRLQSRSVHSRVNYVRYQVRKYDFQFLNNCFINSILGLISLPFIFFFVITKFVYELFFNYKGLLSGNVIVEVYLCQVPFYIKFSARYFFRNKNRAP